MTRGVKKGSSRGSYKKENPKTKIFAGYKYTEDEYTEIRNSLEKYAMEKSCTKSRALYELLTK